MPWLLNRVSLSTAIIAVSVLVHLGFVGAIVFAERRHLPPSGIRAIDVDLVRPEELQPKTEEPAKLPEPSKRSERAQPPSVPQSQRPQPAEPQPNGRPQPSERNAKASPPEAAEAPDEKPEGPSGGPAGEGKSRLTPEEIATLRAQIQKCWKLPVGIPGVMGLEVVLRVTFGQKGQLAGEPVLLQAPAHERGPLLVGIAMSALKECYPFKLPPTKYADWKTLDLKFTATGMAGIAPPPKGLPKKS